MDVKDIEKLKLQAEEVIKAVLKKLENKTGMICVDVDIYPDDKDDFDVNLFLQIKHREDIING